MRKIAVSRTALLDTIDPGTLTGPVVEAFAKLATLVLNTRAGNVRTITDIVPAVQALSRQYPNFTVDGTIVRLAMVSNFIEAVLNKKLDFSKYHQNNLKVQTLIQGTYFGTTSTDPETILQFTDQTMNQHAGEIHMVFDLGDVPGFEYEQLRSLFLGNADVFIKAAQKNAPEVAVGFEKTLGSLKRAKLALPHFAILAPRKEIVLRYNDMVGIIDFQMNPAGQFIRRADFETFLPKLRDFYNKQKRQDAPAGFKLEDLTNRTVVMIGVPPRGWSTDRFQSALRQFNTHVLTTMEYNTTYAFYDPNTQDQEKLNDARRRNIKLIPYQTIIARIAAR